jgi:hypothetical protein
VLSRRHSCHSLAPDQRWTSSRHGRYPTRDTLEDPIPRAHNSGDILLPYLLTFSTISVASYLMDITSALIIISAIAGMVWLAMALSIVTPNHH